MAARPRAGAAATLLLLLLAPLCGRGSRSLAAAAGVYLTDANLTTAISECKKESAAFNCPQSQRTYGRVEDWDVSRVTSLRRGAAASPPRACRSAAATGPRRARPAIQRDARAWRVPQPSTRRAPSTAIYRAGMSPG